MPALPGILSPQGARRPLSSALVFGIIREAIRKNGGLFVACFLCTSWLAGLGARHLNEPDEGRYAGIAAAMAESGDWVSPHFWGLPHFDKPPLAYWGLAISFRLFGESAWAARLPLVFASSLSAAALACLLRPVAGRGPALGSTLILGVAMLFAVMSRMVTTDAFLTASVAWSCLALWRTADALAANRPGTPRVWLWATVGAASVGAGILTKGPAAVAIPLLPGLALVTRRPGRRLALTAIGGGIIALGTALAAPWFGVAVIREPEAWRYLVFNQAMGHLLGTTITNRPGAWWYYLPILAVGFMPWTPWIFGLGNRDWWKARPPRELDLALFLAAWSGGVFILFTLVQAKLPAYILPMFPPLAGLTAWRWLRTDRFAPPRSSLAATAPAMAAFVGGAAAPLAFLFVYHAPVTAWAAIQASLAILGLVAIEGVRRRWGLTARRSAAAAAALASLNVAVVSLESPHYETSLKGNQTLAPLAAALDRAARRDAAFIVWGRLPQGLPFFARDSWAIMGAPFLGGMPTNRPPFGFPGNLARLGPRWLPDPPSLSAALIQKPAAVVVAFVGSLPVETLAPAGPLRRICQSGQWELWTAP